MSSIEEMRSVVSAAEAVQASRRRLIGNVTASITAALGMGALIAASSPTDTVQHASLPGPSHGVMVTSQPAQADMRSVTAAANITRRSGVLTTTVAALDALEVLGADREQADSALAAFRDADLVDGKGLTPGIQLTAHFEPASNIKNPPILAAVTMRPTPGTSLIAKRQLDGTYFAAELISKLTLDYQRVTGTVSSTLAASMLDSDMSDAHISDFAQVFAYNPKFKTGLRAGDEFEVVYETWKDERGQIINTGNIVYAALDGSTIDRPFYRYTPSDNGLTDYFDASGKTAERFLTNRPIPGARRTSGFGRRRHPIGGYVHLHKGVDFAAPMSARIYAAGDGVIEMKGRNGGYGRYVRIRHANGYKTAYAHMSGYSHKIYEGAQIKQGDLVGFVGSTGYSTGPHLHYEVMLNDRHVDPLSLKLPTGRRLAKNPTMLAAFKDEQKRIDEIRYSLGAERPIEIAANGTAPAGRTTVRP